LLRFGYVYAVILVALLLSFLFHEPVYWWYFEKFKAPVLAQEFGFTLEDRQVVLPSGERFTAYMITALTPGGRFARSGMRVGDRITCLQHGIADFWTQLVGAHEGYEAHISVVGAEDAATGCDGARRIRIEGKSGPGNSSRDE